MKNIIITVLGGAIIFGGSMTTFATPSKKGISLEVRAQTVIDEYVERYRPLDWELRQAWFRYASTGDKKASKRQAELELAMRKLQSDQKRFAMIKELYAERKRIKDPLLIRQIELLYIAHLENQVSEEELRRLTDLERQIEEAFSDYRPVVDGKRLSPVDVDHILKDSTDAVLLEKVWKAQEGVGKVIESKFRELVLLRNHIARELGFDNFIALSATTSEFNLDDLEKFYTELYRSTEKPFRRLKEAFIDRQLAKRYGIGTSDLRPWHYQNPFFQEAPNSIFDHVDLDAMYHHGDADAAIQKTIEFYDSMGIDVASIVKRSSLFPKEGKNPHAVAWYLDVDHPNSSVLIMNLPKPPLPPKAGEVSTLVHELSHDINFEAILENATLPYLLRRPTMLTEAVSMLFEEQTLTKDWFMSFGVDSHEASLAANAVHLIDYVDQLVFLRFAATMYCFETRFYADPSQDIGDLWWECKSKHQLMTRPEGWKNPDALAKYHIANTSPLYYSNYAIGRVANVQFAELLAKHIGQPVRGASYFGKKKLGAWLMNDFLAQGERYRWDDFIERSTGHRLSLRAWEKFYLESGLEKQLFER